MKYVAEFGAPELARALVATIAREARPEREYRLMEFCGGHTHAIFRHGLPALLPANLRLLHGPGCPVCVLPAGRVELALELAEKHGVQLCTYGDALRVPGARRRSLLHARAAGARVQMVYSATDALALARAHPERQVVFFALGFETTAPATAVVLQQAKRDGVENFSVLCSHVLTPSAIASILESQEARRDGRALVDGFLGPAHVSAVIGTEPYEFFAAEYARPVVVAGFEPTDILQALLMLVRQLNEGRHEVENQYTRAVRREGNPRAKALVAEVFELRRRFEWRGLGVLPYSALQLKREFAAFDAERRFGLSERALPEQRGCECGAILRGLRSPQDCALFGRACTPENPLGACMVSQEGACAAHYRFGRGALREA